MAMEREESSGRPNLVTKREPVGPKNAGDKGSMGDTALMDAVTIVVIAWTILILIMLSLKSHNI